MRGYASLSFILLGSAASSTRASPNHDYEFNTMHQRTYGVDVSFPQHHHRVSNNYQSLDHNNPQFASPNHPNYQPVPREFKDMAVQPLGNRQDAYEQYMKGCRAFEKDEAADCDDFENDRIEMNIRQPSSMVNYTDLGFLKVKVPKKVFSTIERFWSKNQGKEIAEEWDIGNTYTNHWDAPTYMLDIDDENLKGGGDKLKNMINEMVRHHLEDWMDEELTPTSIYGIRKYTEGGMLNTHVDRLPLVASAVINVAQDVDEDWPLEVFGHDGRAYNVTLEPGDMVLYESHSVLHGRPFPLKGRFYANVFVHFEPVGHSRDHGFNPHNNEEHYESIQDIRAGYHHNGGLPPYIIDGSLEAFQWRREHPDEEWEPRWAYEADEEEGTGSNGAHYAAHTGNVEVLTHIIENPQHRTAMIHEHDNNGWLPIHEAAREGHEEVIAILVQHGVDVNERTNFGEGQSILNLAYEHHDEDSSLVQLLLSLGAVDIESGPDL